MKQDSTVGFRYLFIFFCIVVLCIIVAISYRLISEITQSKFRNNAFSLLLVSKDSKLIYVDKNAKEVLFISIGDVRNLIKGKNNLGVSLALGLPVNGVVIDENPASSLEEFVSSNNEWRLLFNSQLTFKNLNRYDIHKIINAAKSAPEDNRIEEKIILTNASNVKKIEEYFVDSAIINSPYTIQIDNGTSINGLGSEVARILAKEGYNVIAVRTAKRELSSYVAYPGEVNTFIDSLLGLTGFEYKKEKKAEATDITIFLGDDLEAMLLP